MIRERVAAAAGGLSACALGLVLLLYVIPVYVPAPQFDVGGAPGPQAFPRTLAWGFVVLGGLDVLLVLAVGEKVVWRRPEAPGRLLAVTAMLFAALLAIPYVGMLPVGVVLMIAVTTLASGQRLLPSVLTAVLFTAAVYAIFVALAGIPLPAGSLWE